MKYILSIILLFYINLAVSQNCDLPLYNFFKKNKIILKFKDGEKYKFKIQNYNIELIYNLIHFDDEELMFNCKKSNNFEFSKNNITDIKSQISKNYCIDSICIESSKKNYLKNKESIKIECLPPFNIGDKNYFFYKIYLQNQTLIYLKLCLIENKIIEYQYYLVLN